MTLGDEFTRIVLASYTDAEYEALTERVKDYEYDAQSKLEADRRNAQDTINRELYGEDGA